MWSHSVLRTNGQVDELQDLPDVHVRSTRAYHLARFISPSWLSPSWLVIINEPSVMVLAAMNPDDMGAVYAFYIKKGEGNDL